MQIDGFRGALITADHPDYDAARAVWNGSVDRRPRVIARAPGPPTPRRPCASPEPRTSRSRSRGGHNVAGTGVCDDGLVVDLSAMRAVSVDRATRTAWVQGGALGRRRPRDADARPRHHRRHREPHGVGGVSVGGGIGWLMRKYGLTVDNMAEAEYTADGDVIRASVFTTTPISVLGAPRRWRELRRQLVPGSSCTRRPGGGGRAGVLGRRGHHRRRGLLPRVRRSRAGRARHLIRLGTIPPWPDVDEELHFRPAIAAASCYAGPVDEGERAIRPLREFGTPLVDLVGPTPYVDHQRGIDDTVPHGWRYPGSPRTSRACRTRSSGSLPSTHTRPPRRGRWS